MVNDRILTERKTAFGKVRVLDTIYEEEAVRFLMVDGQMESAMYLAKEIRQDLVFSYMRYFNYAFTVRKQAKHTLLIGGGGFAYPKYYVEHFEDKTIDAIEISEDITELAKEYFDVEQTLQIAGERFRIRNCDGFEYLKQTECSYDVIINDAFLGKKPYGYQKEVLHNVKRCLNPEGIYMVNVVTAAAGLFAGRGRKLRKLMQEEFENTLMILCDDKQDLYHHQNILFLASDGNLELFAEGSDDQDCDI